VLVSSIHCYLDPSSGAALCTRELLELQAGRGMDCRVLMTGISVPEPEMSLDEVLTTLELTARRFQAQVGTGGGADVDIAGQKRIPPLRSIETHRRLTDRWTATTPCG
jgi:hypothetical protein